MAKLDVGVGDEFPTEEIHRDEHGVVHHHHYHRRRRRGPFGVLRIILMVMLVVLVFRAFHYASTMMWEVSLPAWMPHAYFPFAGTLLIIAIISAALYFLRCRDDHHRH